MPKLFQQCVSFIKKFILAISRGKINLYSSAMQINFEGIAQELISHLCMLGEIPFSREEGAHEQEEAVSHGGGLDGGG